MYFKNHPYEIDMVNGLCGDPAVFLNNPYTGEAFLFDCGRIDALTHRQILKIRYLFISHCHIDHFVGMDRIIRHSIPTFKPRILFGPPGFASNMHHKLNSYLWNLLENEQLVFYCSEIQPGAMIECYKLSNSDAFLPRLVTNPPGLQVGESDGICLLNDTHGLQIKAALFDHGTAVAGYRLDFSPKINVNRELLRQHHLQPGKWIAEFKYRLARGELGHQIEVDEGRTHGVQWLKDHIVESISPYSVGYLTDVQFDKDNLHHARQLFEGVDCLICESSFMDQEQKRALERKHLTTRFAATVAAQVGARIFLPFHFSNIYKADPEVVRMEAQYMFTQFKQHPQLMPNP